MDILNWLILVVGVCVAGDLSKKDPETFKKVMADTMGYTMGIGILFCFIQLLGVFNIEIFDVSFRIDWNLSPLEIMGAISSLFFCSLIMASWKLPASKAYKESRAKFKNPIIWRKQ